MRRKILAVAGLVVLLGVVFAAGWLMTEDYSLILMANWGFTLPHEAGCTQLYEQDQGGSPHGDGLRYHVFGCEDPSHIEELFDWADTQAPTIYAGSYAAAAESWLDELGVPSAQRPAYDACLYWYQPRQDSSELLIFWDRAAGRLYIAESFL